MSRYFIVQDGQKFFAETEAGARKLAQWVADASGKAVRGFEHSARKKKPAARKKAPAKARRTRR